MNITRYSNLTLDEFLRELESRDAYSDLLLECKLRLMTSHGICPICEGDIDKFNRENGD